GDLVFLSVLDVGAYMPPRTELPEIVSMVDPWVVERRTEAKAIYGAAREATKQARIQLQTLRLSEAPVDADDLAAGKGEVEEAEEQERSAKSHLEEVDRWAIQRDLATHHDHLVGHLRDLAMNGNPAAALAQGTVPRWWAALPCMEPPFTVI